MGARIGKTILWILVALLMLSAVLPFILMVFTSIQNTTDLSFSFRLNDFTFSNYIRLFTDLNFGSALLTTFLVVGIACLMNLVICSFAAYGFTFKRFPGSEGIFWIYLASMMVPGQVTLIPMFLLFKQINLLGGYFSLAIPWVNAFGVFLIRQFMKNIPNSLIEAARIDGASDFRIFTTIILPLIRSVLGALTVFTFLSAWNDFLWPLISIGGSDETTVTLAVQQLQGAYHNQYGLVMAGTTVAFAVPFLLYVIFQRRVVEGVAFSGLKG